MMSNASITEHVSARTSTQNKGCTKVGFSCPAFKCDYQATCTYIVSLIDLHRQVHQVSPMFVLTHLLHEDSHLIKCRPHSSSVDLTVQVSASLFKCRPHSSSVDLTLQVSTSLFKYTAPGAPTYTEVHSPPALTPLPNLIR